MNRSQPNSPYEISVKYLADGEQDAVLRPSTGGGDSGSEEGNYVMQPVLMRNERNKHKQKRTED